MMECLDRQECVGCCQIQGPPAYSSVLYIPLKQLPLLLTLLPQAQSLNYSCFGHNASLLRLIKCYAFHYNASRLSKLLTFMRTLLACFRFTPDQPASRTHSTCATDSGSSTLAVTDGC